MFAGDVSVEVQCWGKIKGKVFTKDEVQAGPNFNLVKVHELVGA